MHEALIEDTCHSGVFSDQRGHTINISLLTEFEKNDFSAREFSKFFNAPQRGHDYEPNH
jgi:hypothetical protein